MKKIITTIVVLLSLSIMTKAQNQSSSGTQSTELALSNAIDITFIGTDNSTGSDVDLVFNNVNDYANGVESSNYRIRVRSNKEFMVQAKTSSNNFSYSGNTNPAPVLKVNNHLFIKVTNNSTGGSVPNAVNQQYSTLKKGNRKLIKNGTPGDNNTFDIQYKATPGFEYPAGTYSVDVIYTATQS